MMYYPTYLSLVWKAFLTSDSMHDTGSPDLLDVGSRYSRVASRIVVILRCQCKNEHSLIRENTRAELHDHQAKPYRAPNSQRKGWTISISKNSQFSPLMPSAIKKKAICFFNLIISRPPFRWELGAIGLRLVVVKSSACVLAN